MLNIIWDSSKDYYSMCYTCVSKFWCLTVYGKWKIISWSTAMESLFCESKHGLILSNSAKNDSTGFRFTPNQHKVLTRACKVLVCVSSKNFSYAATGMDFSQASLARWIRERNCHGQKNFLQVIVPHQDIVIEFCCCWDRIMTAERDNLVDQHTKWRCLVFQSHCSFNNSLRNLISGNKKMMLGPSWP
jgi:hypothetical protein